jgi:16S rRNA (adenine(1408)-N(1))-methyltransferase
MIVVRGKKTEQMAAEELARKLENRERVIVDVGTGDGRFAYRYAEDHPKSLVIGIDAVAENLAEVARKAGRSIRRGGQPNLLFVRAVAEDLPVELRGVADEIHVLLPWGRLLVGCVLADPAILAGLASLAGPGARLRMIFNTQIWLDSLPKGLSDLPRLNRPYVEETMAPAYRTYGIELDHSRLLEDDEVQDLASTWARKLSDGRHPEFVLVEGRVSG